ncbi:MAG: hypothetical protein J7604_18015 [Sporocytophaga sp.]|uniref:hypothetical protein n=1 Tax=Sporocytophaga sp. TaxID=2231183 RepID=UPI001B19B182|nr:hypothetical protein [Sporocytophaga sp.]MBO9702110.1 hypothetical protein [Sporocytophaga sp.]
MAELTRLKIKASSLIEVVVAMVVMVITFGVGMMIYHNILRSGINLQNVKAEMLLSRIAEETVRSKSYFDEDIKEGELIVRKKVGKYQNSTSLLQLEIQVYSKEEKLLAEGNNLILVDE